MVINVVGFLTSYLMCLYTAGMYALQTYLYTWVLLTGSGAGLELVI